MERTILVFKSVFSAIGGFIAYWLGGLDQMLLALIALIVLDYLTGLLKAIHNRALSSEIGFRGIAKKVMTLLIVALAFIIENVTGQSFPLREIVIMFFIVNEGISILENAAQTGLPVPEKLKEFLIQIGGKKQ